MYVLSTCPCKRLRYYRKRGKRSLEKMVNFSVLEKEREHAVHAIRRNDLLTKTDIVSMQDTI